VTLSWDDVRDVLRLIDASSLEELDLEIGDLRLVVRKRPAAAPVPAGPAAREGQVELKSPAVGVFRRAAPGGAAPFVGPGAIADADDLLALIEVAHETRAVSAPRRVRVMAILVEDGQFVEYSQPLMLVEPVA
jgi:biotin carboxyl carrier protein